MDGVTHFANHVIAAQGDFHAESDLFEKLALGSNGGNAEVGATHIDTDRVVGHDG